MVYLPQIQWLGFSDASKYYAIKDLDQAADYLAHPVLGAGLVKISQRLLDHNGLTASEISGSPDDLKLRSCMSLFAAVKGAPIVFSQVMNRYFAGETDGKTKRILELQAYG